MSKQRILDVIQTAQRRAVAIQSTVPGFDFNEALSMEGYRARIDAARDAVFQYIALQSRLNAQRSAMLAARRALAEWSHRMLCAIHSTYGMDSQEYQVIAAATSPAPRRRARKRRSAAVATGRRADVPTPGRSTAQGPVEDVQAVAHEDPMSEGLFDVGGDGGASTAPNVDVGDETEAVRRIEVLAPHEIQEGDARPADEAEREAEIDGSEKVTGENVEGSKPDAVAIDAADARRAMADALAVLRALHEDAVEDGNHAKADTNHWRPDAAEGTEDEAKQPGEQGRDAHGDGDVHSFGGGAPWRACGWEGRDMTRWPRMLARWDAAPGVVPDKPLLVLSKRIEFGRQMDPMIGPGRYCPATTRVGDFA